MRTSIFCFFVTAFLLTPVLVNARQEVRINSIKGASVATNSFVVTSDLLFPTPYDVNWEKDSGITSQRVSNYISLRFDESSNILPASTFTCAVTVQITYTTTTGAVRNIPSQKLSLDFSNASSGTSLQVDKHVYNFSGGHIVNVKVLDVQTNLGSPPLNLVLENKIVIDRFFDFIHWRRPSPVPPAFKIAAPNANNEIVVSWDPILGAESYDLEWLAVNDYDGKNITGSINPNNIDYDFSNNATRVRVSATTYTVSNVFEKGYVLFRYRGVGKGGVGNKTDIEGEWCCFSEGVCKEGKVGSYPAKVAITAAHTADKINWSYNAAYAEQGKKKETVDYMDGTQRSRQTVSKLNTENQTIVGETIYDNEGRAAVNVLPAPSGIAEIKYNSNYNLNSSGNPYNRKDFDVTSGTCNVFSSPMATSSGASKYYSSSNISTAGAQAYLPDASGYPFTQVEYTPDNTGRIKRQSGLGDDMKLGSGHETMYKYGKPLQEQLDRLFGSEVGDCSHYKKNVVRDANGQLTVTYLDQAGHVIATSLAGNNPASLQSIATGTSTITSNILDNQPLIPGDKSLRSQFVYVAVTEGNHVFDYGITAEVYNDVSCMGTDLCMDCVYDLELSVKDECGQELALIGGKPIFKTIGKLADIICDSPRAVGTTTFTIALQPGTYNISKTLTVNQQALNYYTDQYINSNTCIKTLKEFIEEQKLLTDFTSCDPKDCQFACEARYGKREEYLASHPGSTSAEYSELIRKCAFECNLPNVNPGMNAVLRADMGMGGQYGEFTPPDAEGNIVPKDETSIFHESNRFGLDWNLSPLFKDETGRIEDKILLPNGTMGYPSELVELHEYKKLAEIWKPVWSTVLIPYHPEYSHQFWNESWDKGIRQSEMYDFLMRSTETYEEALNLGLLNPLGMVNVPAGHSQYIPVPGPGFTIQLPFSYYTDDVLYQDPYFTHSAAAGYSKLEEMRTYMKDVKVFSPDGLYYVQGIWNIAAVSVTCDKGSEALNRACAESIGNYNFFPIGSVDLCSADRVWKTFRALYLAKKMEMMETARFEYAISNGDDNSNIGNHDGSLMGEKTKRFPRTAESLAATGLTNLWNTDPAQKEASKKEAHVAIAAKCDEQCRLYAESWMEKFKGCSATASVLNELREKLIAVCKQGCDEPYPIGASTVNPDSSGVPSGRGDGVKYYSFDDVIKGVIGNTSELCNADMISMPMPYGHTFSSMTLSGNLDTCACDKVLRIESTYQILRILGVFPYITRKIVAQAFYKLDLDELDAKICECKSAYALVSAGSWVPGAEWNTAAASFLASSKQKVPAAITCDHCVTCDFVTTKVNEYRASYELNNGPITSANKNNYQVQLANHLNAFNNLDLTYIDYLDFLSNCSAAQSSMSCKLTPEAPELEKLLGLLVKTQMNLLDTACLCELPYSVLDPSERPKYNFSYTDLLIKDVDPSFVIGSSVCDQIYRMDHIAGNTLFGQIKSVGTPAKNCQLQLTFPASGFAFSDIVEFKNLRADGQHTGTNFTFLVDAHIISKTKETWVTLNGQSSCFPIYRCTSGNSGMLLCSKKPEPPKDDCVDKLMDQVIFNAKELYKEYITEVKKDFEASYVAKCLSAADNEHFNMKYTDGEYHFTLYYYDQAGNLVRTVPPEGVELVPPSDWNKIKNDRKNNTRTYFTKHRMNTLYKYNGLNQLIAQTMPDHDNISEWKINSSNDGLPANMEITDAGFNGNFSYMFTADPGNPLKSKIYYRPENSSNWRELNSTPLSGLKDVDFLSSAGIGYAVGNKGVLLKLSDGVNWLPKPTSIADDIVGVHITSATEAFLFTKNGKVYKTIDGADSWVLVDGSGLGLREINEVTFTSLLEGFAVGIKDAGGAIFHTSDGGATWTRNAAIASNDLTSIQYLGTSGVAFAAGVNGTLLESKDGGNSWITISTGLTSLFKEIHFVDQLKGCAIAEGKVFYTENGGYSWTPVLQPAGGDEYVDFYFVNNTTGYALSKKGYVQATLNAGESWVQKYKHLVAQDLTAIYFTSATDGYVAGNNGTLIHTVDVNRLDSWSNITTNLGTKAIKEIHFSGTEACALLNDGNIWYSVGSGTSWWQVSSPGNYNSMLFIDNYTGYALTADGTVAYTNNKGSSWTNWFASSGVNPASGFAINKDASSWSALAADVMVVGGGGKISRFVQGSAGWNDVTYAVTPPELKGVNMPSSSTAYAVGAGGILLRTLNGGTSWNAIASGTGNDLNDVGVTGNNATLIGDNGMIMYSSAINLAVPTWTVTSVAGATGNHQRALFKGTAYGYIVSADGKILNSTNSGASWSTYYTASNPLYGLWLLNGTNGFAVGDNGTVVKTAGPLSEFGSVVNPARILDSYQVGSIAYAVGIDRTVLRSDNGGASWTAVTIPFSVPSTTDLRGVMFTETSSVIIVGDGVVVRKKESEASWTVVTVPANLEDVYVIDDNNMYAVGDAGAVYRSSDGGVSWTAVTISPSIPSVNLKSVYIVSPVGYMVGTNGTILKSDNVMAASPNWQALKAANGDDWTKYTRADHTTVTLNDVYFTDLTTGYAIGNSGTVLKTINGGKSWESKQSNSTSDLLTIVSGNDNLFTILGKGSVLSSISDNSDNFSTRFYYDALGRMVASQNSKQFAMAIPRFSYTIYDVLNRIIEVGEVEDPLGNFSQTIINQGGFPGNLNPSNPKKYYVTRTIYDKPFRPDINALFGPNGQENLRNRISTILTQEVFDPENYWDHATYYSYDVHGNVKSIIQDNRDMR